MQGGCPRVKKGRCPHNGRPYRQKTRLSGAHLEPTHEGFCPPRQDGYPVREDSSRGHGVGWRPTMGLSLSPLHYHE